MSLKGIRLSDHIEVNDLVKAKKIEGTPKERSDTLAALAYHLVLSKKYIDFYVALRSHAHGNPRSWEKMMEEMTEKEVSALYRAGYNLVHATPPADRERMLKNARKTVRDMSSGKLPSPPLSCSTPLATVFANVLFSQAARNWQMDPNSTSRLAQKAINLVAQPHSKSELRAPLVRLPLKDIQVETYDLIRTRVR